MDRRQQDINISPGDTGTQGTVGDGYRVWVGLTADSAHSAVLWSSIAPHIYSQYEQYKGHEREAESAAISTLLGISRGTWIISEGQPELRGKSAGSLARFGGPGTLIVPEGYAVILETKGKTPRVRGGASRFWSRLSGSAWPYLCFCAVRDSRWNRW